MGGISYEAEWEIRRLVPRLGAALTAAYILFSAVSTTSLAQTIPAASRSVYKCSANGVTTYSDTPCLGAKRLEIEPTRGVGMKEGHDVQREVHREMFAEAIRPLTGLDAKQLDINGRRTKLSPDVQRECRALDTQIQNAERDEGRASGERLDAIKASLFHLRLRQRDLRC